jgi:FkbM family methyltransferase
MRNIKYKLKLLLNLYFKKINFESYLYNAFKPNDDFSLALIGAHDGVKFDFLFTFLNTMNPTGLAIEPVPEYFKSLQKNFSQFSRIELVNKAIHNELNIVSIYKVMKEYESRYPEWITGCASFYKNHLFQHKVKNEHIEELNLDSITLSKLFSNKHDTKYDLIQIDTEGYDAEIVKDLIKNRIFPSILKFELVNISEDDLYLVCDGLRKNNYFVFKDNTDIIAILKNIYIRSLFRI